MVYLKDINEIEVLNAEEVVFYNFTAASFPLDRYGKIQ